MNGFALIADAFQVLFLTLVQFFGSGVGIWLLAIVFAISGISKLWKPYAAAVAMSEFGVVRIPRRWYGFALGTGEGVLAIALAYAAILPVPQRIPLVVAAVLLSFFVVLIAITLARGKDMLCMCFGNSENRISRATMARTASLAMLAFLLAIQAQSPSAGIQYGTAALNLVGASAVLGIVVLFADGLSFIRTSAPSLSSRARW